jgi:hypothetical protein
MSFMTERRGWVLRRIVGQARAIRHPPLARTRRAAAASRAIGDGAADLQAACPHRHSCGTTRVRTHPDAAEIAAENTRARFRGDEASLPKYLRGVYEISLGKLLCRAE